MSSNTYSAELETDSALRALVLLTGAILSVSGLLLIVFMPLHRALIAVGCLSWVLLSVRELLGLVRGFGASRGLRITAGGALMRLDQQGRWRASRLLPGSMVLPGLAWIRFETERGRHSAELLRGNCRSSDDWRRLQVIWRHIGAAE